MRQPGDLALARGGLRLGDLFDVHFYTNLNKGVAEKIR